MESEITAASNIYIALFGLIGVYYMHKWYVNKKISMDNKEFIFAFGLIFGAISLRIGYWGVAIVVAPEGMTNHPEFVDHKGIVSLFTAILIGWGAVKVFKFVEGFSELKGWVMAGTVASVSMFIGFI